MCAEQDDPSEVGSPALAAPPKIMRGVLAMLRDVSHCYQHPRDEDRLKSTKVSLRSVKRKRRQFDSPEARDVSLQDSIKQNEFTILFFFQPRHLHSLQLRSILSDFCERSDTNTTCLAVFGGDPKALAKEDLEDCKLFFDGTGFLEVGFDDEKGQKACSSLLQFLDVTQIPSVVVFPNRTGRPILGQEMAIEWNASGIDDDKITAMQQRWREGGSGLCLSHSIMSKLLGDSSSACAVM